MTIDTGSIATVVVALIAGGVSLRTYRLTQTAETARLKAKDDKDLAQQRRDVEAEAYSRARQIDDGVVKRLQLDIENLARAGAEREAHAMEAEDRLRQQIAELTARAERAEERANRAERAVRELTERLERLEPSS